MITESSIKNYMKSSWEIKPSSMLAFIEKATVRTNMALKLDICFADTAIKIT